MGRLTPRDAHTALVYVTNNYRRHLEQSGRMLPSSFRDRASSEEFFGVEDAERNPLAQPTTWLMRVGYRLGGGELDLSKTPGPIAKPKAKPKPRS
jgi:hypothetical protein